MFVLHTENGTFHYELAGPPGASVLLFSNSLGTDLSMGSHSRGRCRRNFAFCDMTVAARDSP
jgi:hypothetical protein